MDREEAARLVEQYSPAVYRLAYARTGSREDADDITQETFLRLVRAAPAFRDGEHCKAWLLRVAANCAGDLHRSPWHRRRVPLEEAGECGMVILPCSMKTLAGIAAGYSDNLELRAADVTLKEGRKLVLGVRETPLSRIHLRNMLTLAEMGAVILPPMLTYYSGPQTVEDMTRHIVGKVLDQFGVDAPGFRRWGGG